MSLLVLFLWGLFTLDMAALGVLSTRDHHHKPLWFWSAFALLAFGAGVAMFAAGAAVDRVGR